jgi:hypothetical protein
VNAAGIVINRGHSLAQRVAMRKVHYRTITGKLIQMYSLSLMRGFRGILSYNQTRIKRNGKIVDQLDGKQVKRQMQLLSLILSMCYDGVTNFKRKSDSVWPIYETRAVQEGLFPESEQVFIFHQLIDII